MKYLIEIHAGVSCNENDIIGVKEQIADAMENICTVVRMDVFPLQEAPKDKKEQNLQDHPFMKKFLGGSFR